MNGFIKLHRQILEWEWYEDKNCRLVFIHCLLKANFKDKRWRGKEVKRGSFVTSLGNLSDEVGISKQQLRTVLEKLGKTGEITAKGQGNNTLVIINKYNDYQCFTEEKSPKNNDEQHAGNTPPTHEQHAGNTGVTTTEEGKNDKNDKELLPYEKEFFTICDKFKKITGKSIRIEKTITGIKSSGKYKIIAARLNAGADIEEMIKVITLKNNQWKDNSHMKKNIRFSTLFAASNYEKYLDELDNQETQPQPETTESISITDHYKKYYPDKWQYLDKIGKLKEYEARFTDLKFKYSNIAKSYKNPTITAAFIFEAVQTNLHRHLSGSNEQRRIDSLIRWLDRDLSDYKRNKADVRDEFYQWTQNKDK